MANLDHIVCHNCNGRGHYANRCPSQSRDAPTSSPEERAGAHFSFSQSIHSSGSVDPKWILLDTCSTVDIFCNPDLLRDIHPVSETMTIHYNAGARRTNCMGDLPGYGPVWFHPECIANILSFSRVSHRFDIVYDSLSNDCFKVFKPDGSVRRFTKSASGLYHVDTAAAVSSSCDNGLDGFMFVDTVANNSLNYTCRDIHRAKNARLLQIRIGRPSTQDFMWIISNNLLPNCGVTLDDIRAAEHIYRPDSGALQVKTVRQAPPIVHGAMVPLPPKIQERYRHVTLCADVMFVNGIPFFVTTSRNIRFSTVAVLPNRSNSSIMKVIRSVNQIYRKRGFCLQYLLGDGDFESMRESLADLQITLNTAARDKHVGEVERQIRTIKKRSRCIYNTLPFTRIPRNLVIELVKTSVFWLNSFPKHICISQNMSPAEIVTGRKVDGERHCQFEFGEYVHTHEEHNNTMAPRTIGAIALRPTGNLQGNYFLMSLSTGRVVSRTRATRLPMPNEIIDIVHRMARRQNMQRGLEFSNGEGPIEDNENKYKEYLEGSDDETYSPTESADEGSESDKDFNSDSDEQYDNESNQSHSEGDDDDPEYGEDKEYDLPIEEEESTTEQEQTQKDEIQTAEGSDKGDNEEQQNESQRTHIQDQEYIHEVDAVESETNSDELTDLKQYMDETYG